jgi:hypothetical protein
MKPHIWWRSGTCFRGSVVLQQLSNVIGLLEVMIRTGTESRISAERMTMNVGDGRLPHGQVEGLNQVPIYR